MTSITERLFQLYLRSSWACGLCGWIWRAFSHRKQIISRLELKPALLNGSQNVHLAWSWDLCCLSQISRKAARVSSTGWLPGRLQKLWASVWGLFQIQFSVFAGWAKSKPSELEFSCRPIRSGITALTAFSSRIWLTAEAHLHIISGLQIPPRLLRQKSLHFSLWCCCFRNHQEKLLLTGLLSHLSKSLSQLYGSSRDTGLLYSQFLWAASLRAAGPLSSPLHARIKWCIKALGSGVFALPRYCSARSWALFSLLHPALGPPWSRWCFVCRIKVLLNLKS